MKSYLFNLCQLISPIKIKDAYFRRDLANKAAVMLQTNKTMKN